MLCGYAFLADKCGSSRISLDETARLDTGVNRLVREGNAATVMRRRSANFSSTESASPSKD